MSGATGEWTPNPQPAQPLPMVFDDNSQAMVQPENVHKALADGGKVAQHMMFDDGSRALVPLERVEAAMKDGGKLIGAPPPMPAPPSVEPVATPGAWNAVKNIASLPGAVHQAFSEPAKPEELQAIDQRNVLPDWLKRSLGVPGLRLSGMLPAEQEAQKYEQAAAGAPNPQQREALTDAAGSARIASHIPFVGPLAFSLAKAYQGDPLSASASGNQPYGQEGDPAGALTEGLAYAAAPHVMGRIADEVKPLMPTASDLSRGAQAVTGVAKGAAKASGVGLSPEEMITKAGGPSVTDQGFQRALRVAGPRLVEQHGIRSVESVQDMADAAYSASRRVWNDGIQPQILRHPNSFIDSAPVGEAIRGGIDEGMQDLFPEQAQKAADFADKFDGPITLSKASAYLKTLNAQLKGYYRMSPEGQNAAGITSGHISAIESAAGALRDAIYDKLEDLGEDDPRGLRQQYGALKDVQKVFDKRAIVSARHAPLNIQQVLAAAGGAGEAAGALFSGHPVAAAAGAVPLAVTTGLKYLNSPDMLVKRGMRGLAKTAERATPLDPTVPPSASGSGAPTPLLPPGQYNAPASPLPPQPLLGGQVHEGEYIPMPEPPPQRGTELAPAAPARQKALPSGFRMPASFATRSSSREAVGMPETAEATALQNRFEKKGPPAAVQPPPPSNTALPTFLRPLNKAGRGKTVAPSATVAPAPTETPGTPSEVKGQTSQPPVSTAKVDVPITQKGTVSGLSGKPTTLLTASGQIPASYRVVEARDLAPSHDAVSFAKNPNYPEGVQERAYHTSKEAQQRVIEQAQNYEPAYTVNSNPDAVNGPPVITPDGTVLGGNSRAMSTIRLYRSGADKGAAYRAAVSEQAKEFGVDPAEIAKMKEPVLVRQVDQPPAGTEGMRRLGSDLNKSMTGALGVSERAVSAGKSIKPESLDEIGRMMDSLGEDATLRDVMREHGKDVMGMLSRDGVITDRERPQFVDTASGGLNEEGKTFVERALLGSVVDDPVLLDKVPKSVLGKLGGSLGDLAGLGARGDEYNLLPLLRAALREHAKAGAKGVPIGEHLGDAMPDKNFGQVKQEAIFAGERNPAVDALARSLGAKPKLLREAFRSFAQDARADVAAQGTMLMSEPPSAVGAFNHAFHSNLSETEFRQALRDALAQHAHPGGIM